MERSGTIRRFIVDELMYGDDAQPLEEETPLCEGIVDSIGLVDLVLFLEEEFSISIDDADLTADNFRSVAAIERLVSRRVAGE